MTKPMPEKLKESIYGAYGSCDFDNGAEWMWNELAEVVEALEFYADGDGDVLNWEGVNNPAYVQDKGKVARQALSKLKESR